MFPPAAQESAKQPAPQACPGCPHRAPVSKARRRFIHGILGAGLLSSIGAFLYPVVRYLFPVARGESLSSVVAAKLAELKPNTGKIFKFGSRPGLLIRTTDGEWKAFSAVCTHLSCTVQYRPETQQILCACHNGIFDLTGQVVSGPPPRPLEEFQVNIRGDEVVVGRRA